MHHGIPLDWKCTARILKNSIIPRHCTFIWFVLCINIIVKPNAFFTVTISQFSLALIMLFPIHPSIHDEDERLRSFALDVTSFHLVPLS